MAGEIQSGLGIGSSIGHKERENAFEFISSSIVDKQVFEDEDETQLRYLEILGHVLDQCVAYNDSHQVDVFI